MKQPTYFKFSPWDSSVLGIDAFEIEAPTIDVLVAATKTPGHYTIKTDCLASKHLLQNFGFYYCDTLIEPYCTRERFEPYEHPDVYVSKEASLCQLIDICNGAFEYGRFHRDFSISKTQADKRYTNWLTQLHATGNVYGLFYKDQLKGFIAIVNNQLVLHAISKQFRGQGLAKFLWTPVCRALFDTPYDEIFSSISAGNLAIVNLYGNLGFKFRKSIDVYHRLTPAPTQALRPIIFKK